IGKFISVGLVNQPNLEMAAVARAAPGTPQTLNQEKESIVDEEQLAALRKAYGLADDASVEDVIAATLAAAPKIADEDNASENGEGSSAKDGREAASSPTANAGDDDGKPAVNENAPDLADYVPRSDYDAVRDKLAEYEAVEEAAPSDEEITEAVDGAIQAARVAPSSRANYIAMCATKKGLASFKKFTASSPKIVSGKSNIAAEISSAHATHLTPAEIEVCKCTGISQKSFLAQKQKEKTHA
ncbi:MAG: hypothetical protein JKX72_06250, partial [Robiginitomaculum sp.]|nr:hypothetical protein [Robiginitomaculum sp.]